MAFSKKYKLGKAEDLSGKKFGKLLVLFYIGKTGCKDKRPSWFCKCDCGNYHIVKNKYLKNGDCTSCGCANLENAYKLNRTHGDTSKSSKYHRLNRIWSAIKTRTSNKNNPSYKEYGERGIKMCEEWFNSYEKFKKWSIENGYADNLTIDRIDVNGNYEPSNCRWATDEEQRNNKQNTIRISFNGDIMSLKQFCSKVGLPYKTIYCIYKENKHVNTINQAVERFNLTHKNKSVDLENDTYYCLNDLYYKDEYIKEN